VNSAWNKRAIASGRRMLSLAREYWHIYHSSDLRGAEIQWRAFLRIRDLLESHSSKRVLELGCCRFKGLSRMLAWSGYFAVGIDRTYTGFGSPWTRALNAYSADGTLSAAKEFAVALRRERRFERHLSTITNLPQLNEPRLLIADGSALPFRDESFDALVTHAVLEHVDDITNVVKEMSRVLRSGGFTWHAVHLFTALSGGHHGFWSTPAKVTGPIKVPPWDQLRKRAFAVPVYLNALRRDDYLEAFRDNFELVVAQDEFELGANRFLTPEIRSELSNYSDQELLTRTLVIFCTKGR